MRDIYEFFNNLEFTLFKKIPLSLRVVLFIAPWFLWAVICGAWGYKWEISQNLRIHYIGELFICIFISVLGDRNSDETKIPLEHGNKFTLVENKPDYLYFKSISKSKRLLGSFLFQLILVLIIGLICYGTTQTLLVLSGSKAATIMFHSWSLSMLMILGTSSIRNELFDSLEEEQYE